MRFTIIGSGGCCSLPRPGCECPVCKQAREKGHPWARYGCSLYLEQGNLLVDTPEDIVHALNYSRVPDVRRILYSHADPDHTMGMRVVEQLRLDWFVYAEGGFCQNPIEIGALPGAMRSLRNASCGYGSTLAYYEKMRIATLAEGNCFDSDGVNVTLVPVDAGGNVAVFVFEQDGKKLLYAPCDCLPFPTDERLLGADALVLGNTMHGRRVRSGREVTDEYAQKFGLFSQREAIALRDRLGAKELLFTHLEEDWGMTLEDYRELEARMPGVRFAYDGMTLDI